MLTIINLVGTAFVFIAFGLWGLIDPIGMVANLGLDISAPSGATAIRAIYGGFLIGLGLFILYCAANDDRRRIGLVAILIIVSTILSARIIGAVVDGGELGIQLSYGAIEVFSIIVTASLLLIKRQPS